MRRLSRDPWDRRFADDPRTGRDEAGELAAQIEREPSRLLPHLDWLASDEARSAERLGLALGRIDEGEACGAMIFRHAIQGGTLPLLRGYIRGLVFSERAPTRELIRMMRELEAAQPRMAVDLLVFGGDDFDALNRVISLVESELVPPLPRQLRYGDRPPPIGAEEVGRILPYFVDAAIAADADSARAGVRFLYGYLRFENVLVAGGCLERQEIRSLAWQLVEGALLYVESRLAYEWSEIVMRLATDNPGRAAVLLGQALLSEDLDVEGQARKRLVEMIPQNAEIVMEGLGQALLDPVRGWRLQVPVLRDLVSRMPSYVIVAWVARHGSEGRVPSPAIYLAQP